MASLDKWLYNFAKARKVDRLKLTGYSRTISATTVTSLMEDGNNHMMLCSGTSVPSALDYFAKGCIFIKTDAAASAKALYENVGTASSCSFNLIGEVAMGDIPLAANTILIGAATGIAASIAAVGDVVVSKANSITFSDEGLSKINSYATSVLTAEDSHSTSRATSLTTVDGVDRSNALSQAESVLTAEDSHCISRFTSNAGENMDLSQVSYLASRMVSASYVDAVD